MASGQRASVLGRRAAPAPAAMAPEDLPRQYPVLFHMTEAGGWEGIRRHGLLSTSALLDLYGYRGEARHRLESAHRPTSTELVHPRHGRAVIRDQKPMSDAGLHACLQDGMTPRQWYELLNGMVFFWTSEARLHRLLEARSYRDRPHDVLVVDCRGLVAAHAGRVRLAPINSGCTRRLPRPRGRGTFTPIADYPFAARRRTAGAADAVVELTVVGAVPDIARHVLRVERRQGGAALGEVWPRARGGRA